MLEARSLTVSYRKTIAVDDVTMEVRRGEVVALVGPNGAGKSSLIAALSGDLRPAKGEARIGRADIQTLSARSLSRRRAVLEQSPMVTAPYTLHALVGLGIDGHVLPEEADTIARRAVADVGLTSRSQDIITQLSGGQQRRAHLARALAQLAAGRSLGGGEVLLLDEPTAGIDMAHQMKVMVAARTAADTGVAVLASLHDLSLAAAFSDRMIVMRRGQIVADDAPGAVLNAPFLSEVYETPIHICEGPGGTRLAAPVYNATTL